MRLLLFLLLAIRLFGSEELTLYYNGTPVAEQTRSYDPSTNSLALSDITGTYHITRNDQNFPTCISYPNGITSHFTYRPEGEVFLVEHRLPNGALLLGYAYGYDEKGRIVAVLRCMGDQVKWTAYDYTPEGYLARVHSSTGEYEAFTYDPSGRRLTRETPTTFTDYEYNGDLLTRAGNIYYTYDENGCLKERISPNGVETFTFDGPYLSHYSNGQTSLSFDYNKEGRRIRVVGDRTVEYCSLPNYYDQVDRIRHAVVASDDFHYFSYANTILASAHPEGILYYLYSHPSGNIGAIVCDDDYTLLEFDAFGSSLTIPINIGFNGEWYDADLGLYYLRYRYYDPAIGRFISPDPADVDPYNYCFNDPVNYVDPMGLWGWGRSGERGEMPGSRPPQDDKPSRSDPFIPDRKSKDRSSSKPDCIAKDCDSKPERDPFERDRSPPEPAPIATSEPPARSALKPLKELGSLLVHEVLDAVDQGLLTPADAIARHDKLAQKARADLPPYRESMNRAHESIDRAFGTDHASSYPKPKSSPHVTLAMPPPPIPTLPGAVVKAAETAGKVVAAGTALAGAAKVSEIAKSISSPQAEAGKVPDRAGLTKAGRALMKHGNREGSAFPKPQGNPSQVNDQGQKILESIVNHPERKIVEGEYNRYGKVPDIYAPNLGGVRYSQEGEFIGFLEP
ncbi:MAG: RHS repeat domain-containing protein [Candidatus Obscuribacterales bacterium]